MRKFTGKCRGPEARRRLCASLRSRNALGHFTRATLCGNLQEKCPIPEPRRRLCASLRSRNALGHFTSHFIYAEICRKNARSQNRGADFVRACAVETRLDISRAILFMRKFAGQMHDPRTASRNEFGHCVRATSCKNLQVKCRGSAGAPGSSTGLYNHRKNPSVWTHCSGKRKLPVRCLPVSDVESWCTPWRPRLLQSPLQKRNN